MSCSGKQREERPGSSLGAEHGLERFVCRKPGPGEEPGHVEAEAGQDTGRYLSLGEDVDLILSLLPGAASAAPWPSPACPPSNTRAPGPGRSLGFFHRVHRAGGGTGHLDDALRSHGEGYLLHQGFVRLGNHEHIGLPHHIGKHLHLGWPGERPLSGCLVMESGSQQCIQESHHLLMRSGNRRGHEHLPSDELHKGVFRSQAQVLLRGPSGQANQIRTRIRTIVPYLKGGQEVSSHA